MYPNQTTSLARVLHLSRRTTLALPRATLLYPRNPLNLSSKLSKDGKMMPQEHQCQLNNNICLSCGISGHISKDCSKASIAKSHAAKAETRQLCVDFQLRTHEGLNFPKTPHDLSIALISLM